MQSKSLYIAEKPSVAKEFAKVLNVGGRASDGYLESADAVVTWCVGHLVTMSYPEVYDPKLKKWSLDTLPFLPEEFKYELIDDVKKQFRIVERLLNREDAVLLSGFARAKRGERVLDLGTGTGIIPILMAAKTEGEHFTGLEIQEESADMAARSVACNGLQQKIDIVNGDIKEASGIFGAASFDVVTTNPPYMTDTHGLKNPDMPKAIARHEVLCTLDDVVREGAKVLKPGGRFYMVHRPFRLVEIFQTMTKYKLEPKRMKLVYPMADREPNMVLIEGIRGAKSMIKIEKPLIVYEKPGVYTSEIYDIYGY